MARLTSELIVSLIDRVTAPARRVANTVDRLTAAQRRNSENLGAMRGRLFDAAAAGYALSHALAAPIQAAGDFQEQLDGIRQKADLTAQQVAAVGRTAREAGAATGQGAKEINKSIDYLLGMGASTDQAMKAAEPIGRAATAYNAATEELSSSAFAVIDNLKVPAEQTAKALDIMAQAGKEGGFELKDMAKDFPAITAAAQSLGIRGTKGVADLTAALEVARKGAADGSQAANNMQNFISKIVSKETLKNFHKFGVDVPKELAKAAKAGESPVEHMLGVIDKLTKGGRPELLAKLFSDMQVQQFIRPMLANMDLYRQIRERALNATGVVQQDFDKRLQTYAGRLMVFNAQLQNMSIAIGNTLLPGLTSVMQRVAPLLNTVSELADRFPRVTSTAVALAAGLISLRVATIGARWAFLFLKGGVLEVGIAAARTAGLVVAASKRMRLAIMGATMLSELGGGGLFAGLVAGLSGAAGAVAGIAAGIAAAVAGITAPIWGLIAAIAAVALAVYNYWVPIRDFIVGFASAIGAALDPVIATLINFGARAAAAVGSWATTGLVKIGSWLGIDEATVRAALDTAVSAVTGFAGWIVATVKAIPSQVGDWIADIFTMNSYSATAEAGFKSAGEKAGAAMVAAIKSAFDGLMSWFGGLPSRILAAIGKIDIGSLIHWPTPPGWLSRLWGGGATVPAPSHPAVAGARAAGGAVVGGRTYLVGEEGPELFTAPGDGMVHDAGTTAGMMRNGAGTPAGSPSPAGPAMIRFGDIRISLHGINDPAKIADQVVAVLQQKLGDALSGAQFDQNYAVNM